MNQARLARVLRNMERDGLTQIVISSTASVYYLTGYWVEPMERMLALYIRADGTCRLFANALFALEPQEGLELVLHQDSPRRRWPPPSSPARWGWTRPGPASSSSPFWPPGPT